MQLGQWPIPWDRLLCSTLPLDNPPFATCIAVYDLMIFVPVIQNTMIVGIYAFKRHTLTLSIPITPYEECIEICT